ncbi:Isopentenyl phosphate kinase [Entamoeba marina]
MSTDANQIVLIKIGGSYVTEKVVTNGDEPLLENIHSFSKELFDFLQRHPQQRIILAHGAGSYGHVPASNYHLATGLDNDNYPGIVKTLLPVQQLNKIIVDSLTSVGLKALPFHPFDFCVTDNKRISEMFLRPIQIALDQGFIPVLHGDVAMDTKQGCSILSADQIIPELAFRFKSKRIGFISNSCVLDDNKQPIKEINTKNYNDIKKMLHGSSGIDVTGGMAGKIGELIEAATKYGIESYVFNGNDNAVRKFLEGEDEGTKVCV